MNITPEVMIALITALGTAFGAYIAWQVKKVHTLVNSRATEQDAVIKLLRESVTVLKASNDELRSGMLAMQQNASRIAAAAVPAISEPPTPAATTPQPPAQPNPYQA